MARVQERCCAVLEAVSGSQTFADDIWSRPEGGGGNSKTVAGSGVIEKAAVNFSAVWGTAPPELAEHLTNPATTFYATGVSLIVHPTNPFAPTAHANVRYFETDNGDWWFGGGVDMTPYYLFDEDAVDFHQHVATICGRHEEVADYPAWKRWCDEYFYLPHRGEARGIGGIFFDHQNADFDLVFSFVEDLGMHLLDGYGQILERRKATPFGDENVAWQRARRGRYVEFNLLWDRGTKFGIQSRGRTESILASMPPTVTFEYGGPVPTNPREQALIDLVTGEPRDWLTV
ncbi:MAG: oxygen-dependent coproporphyrinogen oxidase [Acidimicrobiia bacterium]|nr:oxygen-dependent coproporphyrinogen oxidase [Acidimicrobiia bacterium]MBP8180893.1 oxygen-dependent coproporphyrinogen oxidase [Acidimicrobiia bacterium]